MNAGGDLAGSDLAGGEDLADAVVAALRGRGETLSCAESLTGGLVAAAVTSVPGASVVFRGAIVAYATAVKAELLDVPAALLAERGAVDPDVAAAMASGVRRRLATTYGVATTGVAGPDPQDGKPVGLVYVAASGPAGTVVRELRLDGDRGAIRMASVGAALSTLAELLELGETAR